MKFRVMFFSTLVCILISSVSVYAQDDDIVIGEVSIPDFKWGAQKVTFTVTNNSDWFRYVTVVTEMTFEGTYLNPTRFVRSHFPIIPGETSDITAYVNVPGNYGKAKLILSIYDVIDTLDVLIESSRIMQQPFFLDFKMSEEVYPYFDERVNFPTMVANSPLFDNEFSHILPYMLNDGKSLAQIAVMTESSVSFVRTIVDELIRYQYLREDEKGIRPTFPTVSFEESTKGKKLAEEMSDKLAEIIYANYPVYEAGIDDLVAEGSFSRDTNDFLSGGTVLNHRYPVVASLLLWSDLGQKFIPVDNRTLMIYARTDPCKAYIPRHMYAVKGGAVLNGRHYYNMLVTQTTLEIDFADEPPDIICPENVYIRRILRERREWNYAPESQPESFVFERNTANELVAKLSGNTSELITEYQNKLNALSSEYREGIATEGLRYWFWNLTASRTVDKMIERGYLTRRGNGHYKFFMRTN